MPKSETELETVQRERTEMFRIMIDHDDKCHEADPEGASLAELSELRRKRVRECRVCAALSDKSMELLLLYRSLAESAG